MADVSPKSGHENTDLDSPASNNIGETYSLPTSIFKEGHDKSESNKDHYVDIHIHRVVLCNNFNSSSFT